MIQYNNPVVLYSGGSDYKAKEMKNKICNSTNGSTEDARCFYISNGGSDNNDGLSRQSAWETTEAIVRNYDRLKYGDVILFERGGIYRQKSRISVKSGLSFGAYGSGEKPKIYGSYRDYADSQLWNRADINNIWYLDFDFMDAGSMIFDFDTAVGVKKFGIEELTENCDFFHDLASKKIFLYSDFGNPGEVYKNIEIAVFGNMFFIENNSEDISFDNLCIKYGGSHAIGSKGNVKGIIVKNCEISFIGGSLQNYLKFPKLRYGNAVQFWSSAENCIIENNWIHQVYDAGITFQGGCNKSDNPSLYKNISFSNNLIEYCTYSIEFFDRVDDQSLLSNIRFNGNIMRFAGYGWGKQRPDPNATSHITGWSHSYERLIDFSIKNNIFDCSAYALIHWNWQDGREQEDLKVSGNIFYQKKNKFANAMSFGQYRLITSINQKELERAVEVFDKEPQLVRWID